MSEELGITNEGKKLVRDWHDASRAVESLRSQLRSAETWEMNARNHLHKWIVPKDAKEGEQFTIAVGNGWLVATGLSGQENLKWRNKPTDIQSYLQQ